MRFFCPSSLVRHRSPHRTKWNSPSRDPVLPTVLSGNSSTYTCAGRPAGYTLSPSCQRRAHTQRSTSLFCET